MNRPRRFVNHCLRRLPPLCLQLYVVHIESGNFLVFSEESDISYSVTLFGTTVTSPSCHCPDWRRHHLPCKHILAVLSIEGFGWLNLPEQYRSFPQFNLDPNICETTENEDLNNNPRTNTCSPCSGDHEIITTENEDVKNKPRTNTCSPCSGDQEIRTTENEDLNNNPRTNTCSPCSGDHEIRTTENEDVNNKPRTNTCSPVHVLVIW